MYKWGFSPNTVFSFATILKKTLLSGLFWLDTLFMQDLFFLKKKVFIVTSFATFKVYFWQLCNFFNIVLITF